MVKVDQDQFNQKMLNDLLDIQIKAENKMLEKVANRVKKGITTPGFNEKKLNDMQALRIDLQNILADKDKMSKIYTSKNLIKSYNQAGAEVTKMLHLPQTAMQDFIPFRLQRLILETNNAISGTSFRVLRNTMDVYREVVSESVSGMLIGTDTRLDASQQMLNDFAAKGVTGFTDKIGRNWELASYVEMATRTAASRAALQGHVDRMLELKQDLMMVSGHAATCPICEPWGNQVISISGKSLEYPSLDTAQAEGLFHPNCKHTLTVWIEDLEGNQEHAEQNTPPPDPDKYNAIQKQRYLERKIRESKRIEAVAMTPEAKIKAANRTNAYQAKQREHVKQWDLRRKYVREGIKHRTGDATKATVKKDIPAPIVTMSVDPLFKSDVEMFHYTNKTAYDSIMANGFNYSDNSMYGKGIYFTDSGDKAGWASYGSEQIKIDLKEHKQLVIDKGYDAANIYMDKLGVDATDGEKFRLKAIEEGYGSIRVRSQAIEWGDSKDEWYTIILDKDLIIIKDKPEIKPTDMMYSDAKIFSYPHKFKMYGVMDSEFSINDYTNGGLPIKELAKDMGLEDLYDLKKLSISETNPAWKSFMTEYTSAILNNNIKGFEEKFLPNWKAKVAYDKAVSTPQPVPKAKEAVKVAQEVKGPKVHHYTEQQLLAMSVDTNYGDAIILQDYLDHYTSYKQILEYAGDDIAGFTNFTLKEIDKMSEAEAKKSILNFLEDLKGPPGRKYTIEETFNLSGSLGPGAMDIKKEFEVYNNSSYHDLIKHKMSDLKDFPVKDYADIKALSESESKKLVLQYLQAYKDGIEFKYEAESKIVMDNNHDAVLKVQTDNWSQFRKTYTAMADEWVARCPVGERKAIEKYTGSYYGRINRYLRGIDKGDNVEDSTKELYRKAKAGLEKSITTEDIVVRRGTSISGFAGLFDSRDEARNEGQTNWMEKNINSLVGRVGTDKGFLSVSPNKYGGFNGDVNIKIELPKGSQAAYVDNISQNQGEKEILLQAGYSYEVLRIDRTDRKDSEMSEKYTIYMKAIPFK